MRIGAVIAAAGMPGGYRAKETEKRLAKLGAVFLRREEKNLKNVT